MPFSGMLSRIAWLLLVPAMCLVFASCAQKPAPEPEPPAPAPEKAEVSEEKPPTPPPVAEIVDSPSRLMYAAQPQVKLYSGPDVKDPVVASLRLGDKVRRMKRRGGFAYVKAVRTGLKGWVINAMLSETPVSPPKSKEQAREVVRERVRQGGSAKDSEAVIFENF